MSKAYLRSPARCEYKATFYNPSTGKVVHESTGLNIIVNTGRELMIKNLFGFAGSSTLACVAVGSSSTTAAVTDTHLTYEILGASMRPTLTNTSGAPLSASDIVSETVTVSGVTYHRKIVVQVEWASGIGTGYTFAEYMLTTTSTQPGTPTTTSGIMFNHYIDPSPAVKGADTAVQLQVSLRW